jgi:hypothetical protein
MTRLYFVAYDDAEGEDCDLMVEATSVEEAIALWREWMAEGVFDDDLLPSRPDQVFEVPALTGKPQAFGWHSDTGMRKVA